MDGGWTTRISAGAAPAEGRLDSLESLRGLAALVVVFSHLMLGFFPRWLRDAPGPAPWARVWYQGDFAVDLFFVLSGFVLSYSFLRTGQIGTLRSAAVRRYWRLFVPVAASILLSYLLLAGGLYANREAARLMGQDEAGWLHRRFGVIPKPGTALLEAVWGSFFTLSGERQYNAVLWTMAAEFIGSLFVFTFLALSAGLRNRFLIYAAAGVALQGLGLTWLLEFLVGAAVCEGYHLASTARVLGRADVAVASLGLAAAGLMMGGSTAEWLSAQTGLPAPPGWAMRWFKPLGAASLLVGVLGSSPLQRALSVRPLLLLGRMSFPLYLVHLIVECSLGCWAYLGCVAGLGLPHGAGFAAAAAATLSASLALAWVGARTVEPLSIRVGRWVYATAFEPRPAAAPAEGLARAA